MLFIDRSIADFARRHNSKRITVLFPDDGARKRYTIDPAVFRCNMDHIDVDVFNCSKKRNPVTGAMEGFEVPLLPEGQPAIIIDDICDGGATFVGIAKAVRAQYVDNVNYPPPLGLYVTHGIFSKGFGDLNEYFNHIYTTDSMPEKGPNSLVTVYSCAELLIPERDTTHAA